jgi:hypothetical protein
MPGRKVVESGGEHRVGAGLGQRQQAQLGKGALPARGGGPPEAGDQVGGIGQVDGGAVQADQPAAPEEAARQTRLGERPGDATVQFGQRSRSQAAPGLGDRGLGGESEAGAAAMQPAHAFQQAAQHLAVGRMTVQRQGHDVVNNQPRRQRTLSDALRSGVRQHRINQRRRDCCR